MNTSLLLKKLPEDIINNIKEYALSPDIRLEMFYQKYGFDEIKFKKLLKPFTSKQLEQINWKYLYYKIYKTSPPRCDNNNLVSIFDNIPNPLLLNVFSDIEYEPMKIYNCSGPLYKYRLGTITRSDYYSENTHTEKGKKRQQYKNIIDGWKSIHNGQGTSKIPEIDKYIQNMEFELIRAVVLYPLL
jgi:hypothetical protein